MMSAYDFWLVDLDGTIVGVDPTYVDRVMELVGERVDYEFSSVESRRLWHGLGAPPEEHLRAWGIDPTRFWTAFHEIEDPAARAEATFLYPDAKALARVARPVGLVTHCQSYLTEPILEALDIAGWFDVVVCCDDEIGWKPSPRPVERAIAALGMDERTRAGVLVGDTAADVGAAWNAGLDGIHLERHGAEQRGCCVRADVRVESFDELFDPHPVEL